MDAVKPSIKSRLESRLEVNTASNVKSRLDLKTKDEPRKVSLYWPLTSGFLMGQNSPFNPEKEDN